MMSLFLTNPLILSESVKGFGKLEKRPAVNDECSNRYDINKGRDDFRWFSLKFGEMISVRCVCEESFERNCVK